MQIPRLREWREARALTQVELADKAGVSPRSVASYEAGGGARPPTVRRLAEALDIEVADLRGEPTRPKEESRSSLEPSLFNGLEEERRKEKYLPWLVFADRYAARWHKKAHKGGLTRGEILEWQATVRDLGPIIGQLRQEEERGLSPERRNELAEDLIMWQVASRILGPLEEILSTKEAFNETELAQLRRERERLQDLGKAANG